MKLYLAGPLFTSAERSFNVRLAEYLEDAGFEVWLPQAKEPREFTAKAIFTEDVKGIDWADTVVACMDGPDPDSGTCWECGYAFAKGKQIVTYRTDFRGIGDAGLSPFNLMMSESSNVIVVLSSLSEGELELFRRLRSMLITLPVPAAPPGPAELPELSFG